MVRYLGAALMLLSTLVAYPQTRVPAKNEDSARNKVFRVNVDLVQVDAVVTDSDGRPVDDLTAEDFIILQDGKAQEITGFSMIRTKDSPVRPAVVLKTSGQKQKSRITPPPPPVELKRDQVRRTIALVVDDLGLSFEGTVRVRESIKAWIDNEMQPGDLVAVILTGSGMGSLQQFTGDKRMLHSAANRIMYNLSGRVGVSSFAPISSTEPVMSAGATEERNMALTLGTLGSIQYVLTGLKSVPGRKSLILFSESMGMLSDAAGMMRTGALSEGREEFVRSHLQRLTEEANRAAVVIHAVDPRGVVYTGPTAEDDLSQSSGEDIGNISGNRTTELISSQDGMVKLTQLTGGLFEHSRNDIDGALKEVVNDGMVYYLIGYQPDRKTVSKIKEGKQQFHSIKVRVKRPGLSVRSRSGFFGSTDQSAEPLTRRERMRDALYSPFTPGTLPVRLTTLFSQTKDGAFCINALLHFDTSPLTFTEEEGWQKAVVDIVVTTFDVKGEQIDLADRTWTIMAKGETFKEMQKCGVVFLMRIPVKKWGAYQMRAVVSDTESGQLGSASHFIEIPDVGKGHLALSGIALASEQRQAGSVADREEGMVADSKVNGTVAVRVFKPGDAITWAYQVLNAKTGNDHKSQLQTYVRLFHEGREVYVADTAEITREMHEDSNRLIGTGRMQLNKILPGDYALQVIVMDMLAGEKNRVAEQYIKFEVQGAQLTSVNPGLGPQK
jgi:VWFA-related protein